MAVDFTPFKDIAPERRVLELQKLIAMLKKEIEVRQEDIRRAEHLQALADEEARVLEQVEVPETKMPRKTQGTIEEKTETKRTAREEQLELEELLATAPERSPEVIHQVAHRPVSEIYTELRRIYERQQETGVETTRDREMIYAIRRGLEVKKEEIEEGQYRADQTAKHLMTAAEQMAENMYKSTTGTYKRGPT